jgi:hypothetical protein
MSTTPGATAAPGWNECCRWFILVRAARVALLVRVILLALVGVVLTELGWNLVVRLVDEPALAGVLEPEAAAPAPGAEMAVDASGDVALQAIATGSPLVRGWAWPMQPLTQLYRADGARQWIGCILAGLWSIAVWALFGGAIARIAAVYLAYGETIGPIAALRASLSRWPSTAGAPLLVLGAILLLALPLAVAGLLLRFDLMAFLLGLVWFVALAIGVAIAIVAIGLAFGWPMMWSTVAVERTDAFDAISRGYAYVFQRPLHALFFVAVAALLGLLAQAAVELFVDGADAATSWAVATGAGEGRWHDLRTPPHDSRMESWAAATIDFWTRGLRLIAASFPLAYLFPAATAIYLLLRRLIDSAELTEAAYEPTTPERGLPPLATDPLTGVPRVAEPSPPAPRRPADPHDPPVTS